MWFWEAAVLVLRCDSCGKKMCSFDSGKPNPQGKNIFWEQIFWRSCSGGLNYIFAIFKFWAGDSLSVFYLSWRIILIRLVVQFICIKSVLCWFRQTKLTICIWPFCLFGVSLTDKKTGCFSPFYLRCLIGWSIVYLILILITMSTGIY